MIKKHSFRKHPPTRYHLVRSDYYTVKEIAAGDTTGRILLRLSFSISNGSGKQVWYTTGTLCQAPKHQTHSSYSPPIKSRQIGGNRIFLKPLNDKKENTDFLKEKNEEKNKDLNAEQHACFIPHWSTVSSLQLGMPMPFFKHPRCFPACKASNQFFKLSTTLKFGRSLNLLWKSISSFDICHLLFRIPTEQSYK